MRQRSYLTFTGITIAILLFVAVSAGTGLWLLHNKFNTIARFLATTSVMNRGQRLVQHLSNQPAVVHDTTDTNSWNRFSALFDSLDSTDDSIQYVSVTRDGLTLFNRHSQGGLDRATASNGLPSFSSITMDQKLIDVGGNPTPLLAFTKSLPSDKGGTVIEVALRRDSVEREELYVTHALDTLYHAALTVFFMAFAVCILVAVWMIRREAIFEKRRREEEHLLFSGVLADGIVHDFRNPMSSMRLDVQMLEREALKPEPAIPRVTELTKRITATMDRLDQTFQEFFQISKPSDAGPMEVNLVDCLQECLNIAAPTLEQANIMVQLKTPQAPLRVTADRTSLRRALLNVITNAKQFSNHGDTIRIDLAQNGNRALIAIEDNGPGIPREQRDSIFDMFVSNRPGGTGLGLFLTRTALEGMKGSIRVVDPPSGTGSRFEIVLPLIKA